MNPTKWLGMSSSYNSTIQIQLLGFLVTRILKLKSNQMIMIFKQCVIKILRLKEKKMLVRQVNKLILTANNHLMFKALLILRKRTSHSILLRLMKVVVLYAETIFLSLQVQVHVTNANRVSRHIWRRMLHHLNSGNKRRLQQILVSLTKRRRKTNAKKSNLKMLFSSSSNSKCQFLNLQSLLSSTNQKTPTVRVLQIRTWGLLLLSIKSKGNHLSSSLTNLSPTKRARNCFLSLLNFNNSRLAWVLLPGQSKFSRQLRRRTFLINQITPINLDLAVMETSNWSQTKARRLNQSTIFTTRGPTKHLSQWQFQGAIISISISGHKEMHMSHISNIQKIPSRSTLIRDKSWMILLLQLIRLTLTFSCKLIKLIHLHGKQLIKPINKSSTMQQDRFYQMLARQT